MPSQMENDWESSWLDGGNQSYLEDIYQQFITNPEQLDPKWRQYFASLGNTKEESRYAIEEYFKKLAYQPRNVQKQLVNSDDQVLHNSLQDLIFSYRLLGHMRSNINPLEPVSTEPIPELELRHYALDKTDLHKEFSAGDLAGLQKRTLQQILSDLKKIYCGTVASEFMHIPNAQERLWVQQKLENTLISLDIAKDHKIHALETLTGSDGLERYLGAKYPGAKRFSLEGNETLAVALDEIITEAGTNAVQEIIIAMAHRGRLNVLVNLLGKMPGELFDMFEEKLTLREESGDVKYHQGFSSDVQTNGGNVHLSLAFNPSHLEIVTPVAGGSVRARQERRPDQGIDRVLCVAIHGDASFTGQGTVMETLNMSGTSGFNIGGTIHIIVNNQIGFTTNPIDGRSTLYCSDIGKMLCTPVFHINADDPEAVIAITRLALEYRLKFHKDVIIDLIGYRRWGHNEADEPSATQPLMYQKIKAHLPVKDLYSAKLISEGIINQQEVEDMATQYRNALDKADQVVVKRLASREWKSEFASDWTLYNTNDWRFPTSTKVPLHTIRELANARDKVPDGFTMDPRVGKIIDARRQMTEGKILADWGYAETLAYASLLNDGYGVRLSGQDCGRGTFFHRQAQWHDHNNGDIYVSLNNLLPKQGKFQVVNSLLSEAAVLGFEYGFSTSEPRTLTLWEAQFGDFANSAQVVIDQFICSGEQKWGRLSGLVMLLPHGYEGQGPEHSSARIERYLQMCAQHNMQVCVPSTPAQMYHLLRRQMLRPMRKPLIVMTPKSLLRHKEAVSSLDELADGTFQVIIPDQQTVHQTIDRLILCSGKVYYDLLATRQEFQKDSIAIIRIEQLYPFPETELALILKKYESVKEIIWCQEEPMNQGAWYSMQHHLRNSLLPQHGLQYVGRPDSASPAVGSHKLHEQQQHDLVYKALGLN